MQLSMHVVQRIIRICYNGSKYAIITNLSSDFRVTHIQGQPECDFRDDCKTFIQNSFSFRLNKELIAVINKNFLSNKSCTAI